MAQPFFTNPFLNLQNYGQQYLATLQQQQQSQSPPGVQMQQQTQQQSANNGSHLQQQQQLQNQFHHHQTLSERVRQLSEIVPPQHNINPNSNLLMQQQVDNTHQIQQEQMYFKEMMMQQQHQQQISPPFGGMSSAQSTQPTLQQIKSYESGNGGSGMASNIKNVWLENFEEELPVISELLDKYPYVAMDTEFPGVVIDEIAESFRNSDQREYMKIKSNVDILKIIQVGITLSDEQGNHPEPVSTWQFNFNFDIDSDSKSSTSISLLQNCGIDFQKLKRHGISPQYFADKITTSGLVLNENIYWICFHGCYDFAYLVKIMMGETLPKQKDVFFGLLRSFFPNIYDLKTFQHEFSDHFEGGGLNRIADLLGIQRVGITHQAGSDSFVTAEVFFKLKTNFQSMFQQIILDYNCEVYGFNNDQAYPNMSRTPANQIHINSQEQNYSDEDAIVLGNDTSNFYNYVPNATEFDGGFFYEGLNNNGPVNARNSLFPSRSHPPTNNIYHHQQAFLDTDNFVNGSASNKNGHHMLHHQSTTPPPLMIDNQFVLRNLTPGANSHHSNQLGYSQSHPGWNYYGNSNHHSSFNNGTFYQ